MPWIQQAIAEDGVGDRTDVPATPAAPHAHSLVPFSILEHLYFPLRHGSAHLNISEEPCSPHLYVLCAIC